MSLFKTELLKGRLNWRSCKKGIILSVFLFLFFVSVTFSSAPDRNKLLNFPQYLKKVVIPKFSIISENKFSNTIKVVSSRNNAFLGFNDPSVEVYLPRIDNSVYSIVTFKPNQLFDDRKQLIEFELEQGIYDHDAYVTKIRFKKKLGEGIIRFARVKGILQIQYPLKIKTLVAMKGKSKNGVKIDGPYLEISIDKKVPEAASFSGISSIRVFDKKSNRLKKHNWIGYSQKNKLKIDKYAYYGKIHHVEIDMIEKWCVLEVSYDLPSAPLILQNKRGTPVPAGKTIRDTPGGKIKKKFIKSTRK